MKYINFGVGSTIDTFATHSSTNFGHSNSAGAMGVAASVYLATPAFGTDPPLLNDFSAKGGTPILFDTLGNRLAAPVDRQSPQVTGVDGANTTFFGSDISQDADSFPNFFGTSAAAPHVAAVAALMMQAAGGPDSLSPQSIYSTLEETAHDILARVDFSNPISPIQIPIDNGAGFDVYSGFGLVDALAAIQLVLTTVNINDVTKNEGDEGLTEYVFTVSFSGNASLPVTVAYATANATAVAAADYIATSGTLTFLPGGPTVQTITVQVVGDTVVEPDETFLLNIDVANARAIRSRAVGTILNDDVDLSIGDVTVVEGNAGTVNAVFAVSIIGVRHQTVTVDYDTLDGTAQAPDDYSSRNGTVTLGINSTGFAVTVPVNGDSFDEADETFFVKLSNAAHAHLAKDTGVGTILDDDPLPGVYVNDVHVTANLDGTLVAPFTVALDNRSGRNVSVHYVTHDDTAVAGVDYEPREDDLTFVPGVSTLQVAVPVTASSVYSADQRFFLDLSNPSNAKLADSHGIGTLIYADPPPTQFIIDDGDEGFSTSISGGWINQTNLIAYQLDHDYHAAGNGSGAATWTFDEIPAGTYQVFTRWTPFSNRATSAPYTVLDGGTTLGTVTVNQQLAPTGEQSNGIIWQSLGTFTTSTGTLRVRLNDNANGFVIADAVRIVADGIGQQVPEIDVAGFEHSIAAGGGSPVFDNGTEFGTVPTASNSVTHTFVISNSGNAALNMIGNPRVQISGADAQDFTVIEQPDASVAAGASTTFSVLFHPTAEGLRQATVLIESDDASEPSYTFTIEGTGGAPDRRNSPSTTPAADFTRPATGRAAPTRWPIRATCGPAAAARATTKPSGTSRGSRRASTRCTPPGSRSAIGRPTRRSRSRTAMANRTPCWSTSNSRQAAPLGSTWARST